MKLGFIGAGNMGNPMAANMIKAGHDLTVHDLRREAATNLLEMGARWADTPKDAVGDNEIVFTSPARPQRRGGGGVGRFGAFWKDRRPPPFTWTCPPTPQL